jgi:phage gpG-like protein
MIQVQLNTEALERHMKEIRRRALNLSQATEIVAGLALSQTQLRFRNTEKPDGGQWERLAEATIKRRRRGSSKPLNNTGTHILHKISSKSDRRSARVGMYDSDTAGIGAAHNYGMIIHYPARTITREKKNGTKTTYNRKSYSISMPERKFLGYSAREVKKYKKIVTHYIMTGEV